MTEPDLGRVVLHVPDGDQLRRERLTRALRDELAALEGVSVEWSQDAGPMPSGVKAALAYEGLLLAVTFGRVVAPAVVKLIEAWLKARSEQVLIVEHEGAKLELRGARGKQDMEVLSRLLER